LKTGSEKVETNKSIFDKRFVLSLKIKIKNKKIKERITSSIFDDYSFSLRAILYKQT